MRKLEHFQIENKFGRDGGFDNFRTPLTLSVCEALVCLKLHFVRLNVDLKSLSLPCLKILYLEDVVMPSDAAAEALISSSPVLEVLRICLSKDDFVVALRVRSPSLKSFTLKRVEPVDADTPHVKNSVVIDAPKLEYLSLMDYYHFRSFKITSAAESLRVDIDVEFAPMNDFVLEMIVIYSFLYNFSGAKDMTISFVKDMTVSWKTLQFIYDNRIMTPLPIFHELTRLHATVCLNASPGLLEILLESCPNLKHLKLELFINYSLASKTRLSTAMLRRSMLSSLESVEIESPVTEEATELDLARRFMRNSTTLKKLLLRLNESTGVKHKPCDLEQLQEYSMRYGLSQFEVLPVVPSPNPLPEGGALAVVEFPVNKTVVDVDCTDNVWVATKKYDH
ncbi:F-box/FBD/LRR-repeat protein [Raphanus sativus]|nr:F-box/FBD/LRR-repeat protein [Raphanus sativus]